MKINRSAVIFDLDGTLIDSMRNFYLMVQEGLEKRGINTKEKLTSDLGTELIKDSEANQAKRPGITLIPRLFWKVGRKTGLSWIKTILFTFECVRKARKVYYEAPLFPDTIESLKKLKEAGYELGIYTMASRKQTNVTMEKYNLFEYFDSSAIISRDDVSYIKPHPEGVILALKGCSVDPENGIYIGDLPADIASGERAGTKTIALTTGLVDYKTFTQVSNPSIILNSLQEASEWILNEG
ncbi:MAG: HAD family hydrolase [Candidatus Heimdallarchaeota archaeon]|nr:HAD family hydrolase [Candidatus Heimdallarchaeota archaeon]